MIIVDDHLAVWALAGRASRLWPDEVPTIPWGFHFRLVRALLDSRVRGRLSDGIDERMVRAALAPPTDVLTVLDPRYLTVTAAQIMSRHRLSVVTSELDEDGRARLKPDLSWWEGGICSFVGDAKYKNLTDNRSVPGADLYQLLAYATALNLPGGLLVYAQSEADTWPYRVKHTSKRLEVMALDLSGTLDEVLERVRHVAERVRALRVHARQTQRAA